MSPMVETPSLSNTGSHIVPLLVVFQTPPEAVPTYTMLGLLSRTAKSSMRPPITAGPISRNSRFLNLSVGLCGAAAKFTAIAPNNNEQATIVRSVLDVSFISISSSAKSGILLLPGVPRIQSFWNGKPTLSKQTRGGIATFHRPVGLRFVYFLVAASNSALVPAFKSLRAMLGYRLLSIPCPG